jgi:hypothetical protein
MRSIRVRLESASADQRNLRGSLKRGAKRGREAWDGSGGTRDGRGVVPGRVPTLFHGG